MHFRVEISATASGEISHLAFVKVVSHAHFESSRNHGDVFPLRMPVWRDAISIGHLQPYRVVPASSTWIALKDRELRPCGHKGWCRTVGNGIRCERVFRGRTGLGSTRENQYRCEHQGYRCSVEVSIPFHRVSPLLNFDSNHQG